MRLHTSVVCFAGLFLLLCVAHTGGKKGNSSKDVLKFDDLKAFKKLLRTKTNVLTLFAKTSKDGDKMMDVFGEAATKVKGEGTMVFIDCSKAKKACKRLDAEPRPTVLKHYLNGDFNKDYDRRFAVKSLASFMKNPTADAPWEEDPESASVQHLHSTQEFQKFLSKEKKPILFMFYVPWCGFCKKLKPEFAAAASALKKKAVLAAMDIESEETYGIRQMFNITGFPTIYYFKDGDRMLYGGERDKAGIIEWMKDPSPPKPKEEEKPWSAEESDVHHLTTDNFDSFMAENPSVLVMFYAPWCGHCKAMKPEYMDAATQLKTEETVGALAAVDCTKEKELGERFEIKGFPTVKYFQNATLQWDFNGRKAPEIMEFMKDPKEPPPPPPPEQDWKETSTDVVHLEANSFKQELKRKKHALVFFYAPWCGHCKNAKPEFSGAAEKMTSNKVMFAAVDCTAEANQALCSDHGVQGYPTILYFNYFKNSYKYKGGRTESDFMSFMSDPQPQSDPPPEPQWSDTPSQINHLTDQSFDGFVATHGSVLVMFYAPWCGHCKAMKPFFHEAAEILDSEGVDGALAAVDCTRETGLAQKYSVQGYPTIKYFKNGEESFDYSGGRATTDLVSFMKNPVSDDSPEPVIGVWGSEVMKLDQESFDPVVANVEHTLVFFYTSDCQKCVRPKDSFEAAANQLTFGDSTNGRMAAVDCTEQKAICKKEGVKSFPTVLYFVGGQANPYKGGMRTSDLVSFMSKHKHTEL